MRVNRENRFIGEFPKVGIRPAIDGRRKGVRDALENQTMNMARSVARLISENLCYPDGSPVECIIADTCIGGVYEASLARDKFLKAGVGLSLTVTPSWCYGAETMDFDPHIPKAIWGFNGTERSGAVYLAAVLAAHNQKGLPAFGIYGQEVQDADDESIPEDVQRKILQFTRSGLVVAQTRDKSYLSIGSTSMGIAGSIVDELFFQRYLGMRNESVDMTEIYRRVEQNIYDHEEFVQAWKWVQKNCIRETSDPKDWQFVVKMTMIVRDLMVGNPKLARLGFEEEALGRNAIAAGFQGQRQWTDHFPNGDFMEAILNSSFDWNGLRRPFIVATENDSLNAVCMLFGHLLTNTAQIFADVRTFWSPDSVRRVTGGELTGLAEHGLIHLKNSGSSCLDGSGEQTINGSPALKPFWAITEDEMRLCLDKTNWYPAHRGYFRGGGFSSHFVSRGGMPVTMTRINLLEGLGPVLQVAEGYTVDLPERIHRTLDERTDPTWPTTWFAPILTGEGAFKNVYSVMNNWGANHCVLTYGHVGADFLTLASMFRIPVCMHNVREELIFRPSAWSAFGTVDLEQADYRACLNYGPLYK